MNWTAFLLSKLFLRRPSAAGLRKPRPASRRVRPAVELLEDRLTPSSLQISLSPHAIVEAPGPSSTAVGTVTRVNADNSQPMSVTLGSSNNAEVTFPSSVVIPAGQASTTFNVTAVPDSTLDATQNVTITGTGRVTAPTALDPTFGGTGSVVQNYIPEAVAIQPDGKVVTAGTRYNGTSPNTWDFAVSRYNPDGSLDTSFGGTGTVYTDLSGQTDQPHAVVIQSDGKIVVGGTGGNGPHFLWELARYNTNGSLDGSFGNGGVVLTNPNPYGYYNEIWNLALQPDGKILAAGNMDVGSDGEFSVARYNANGTLDATFGSGGIATSNPSVGYGDRAFAVVVQPADGKIILAGGSKGGNFDSHFAVSRFTPAGVLDTTFGGTGTVVTDVPGDYEQGQGAVLQPDGKLVVVGYVSPAGLYPTVNNFALTRYNANGSLDTTFGNQGFTITDFGGNDSAARVALQADGRIEVVGSGVGTSSSTSRTVVAWYTPSGALGGSIVGPNAGVQGQDVALQSDGGVVAVSSQTTQFGGYVERYYDSTPISGSDTIAVQDPAGPVAFADSYAASENTPLSVSAAGVLANDTDGSGAPLTAIQLSNPTNGTATLNGDGSFTYTPNPGFFGTDSFTYKANDGTQDSNSAIVTITVAAPTPTAGNDSYSVNENTTLTVAAPGVLANDSDADGNPQTAVLVTKPGHGSVQLAGDGSFTYTPSTYFYGADSFTYEAYNGSTYSSPATVSITVNHVNQPPTAASQSFAFNENGTLSIQRPGVLANSSDPDGDPLTAVLYAGPAGTGPFHGTLTLNPDGSFVYTPNANFYGTDSFTYRAYDGSLYSNVATATLTVKAVPPTANNDAYSVNENSTLAVAAPGLLANDKPTTSDALSASLVSAPTHGSLSFSVNGSFTYTPNANFYGTDSFTYHDVESGLTSNTATVTITVNFVDRPPVAVNDAYTVNEDGTLNVTAPTGLATSLYLNSQPGDYIGQGQTNTWTTATGTFHVSHSTNDNYVGFSYQDVNPNVWWYVDLAAPNGAALTPGYYGNTARYPFQAANQPGLAVYGEGRGSNTLTGNFTVVQAVYDASGQVLSFDVKFEQHSEGATPALFGEVKWNYSATALGVLANDSDPDGQAITAGLVSGPAHGSVTLNPDGTFSYKPNEDYVGTDSFTYQANDGTLNSNTATVTITVNPVNEAPSFVKGADQTTMEGAGAQTVPGWATAISAGPPNESNQTLNFLVSTNNNALFSVAPVIDPATGALTYTTAPGVLGSATVTVLLHDNGGTANGGVDTSTPQTFTITVNDATPTFTLSGPTSVNEGSPYTLGLAANDPDAVTQWTVTWGDGSVQAVSGNPSSVTHLFPYGANNYTISATGTDEDGTHAANTVAVSVNPVRLSITAPAGATAGSPFALTVTALDSLGNPDTTYSGTVHFTSSDGLATLPADYTFVAGDAGSHVFDGVLLDTAGTQSVAATDTARGTITGGATTTVSPAAAARFAVSALQSATAGAAFTETVTALDAFGNVATGYTGTVHFTSSDAQATLPADYTFGASDQGTHGFSVILRTAGVQSLTATDAATASVAGSQGGITVSPATAATFSVGGFPSPTTAGIAGTFTVTARDAYGNVASGYTGTVHFTSSDGQASLPPDYQFTAGDAGVHAFSATLKTAGAQSITATDAGMASLSGKEGNIVVVPAAAATMTAAGFPAATTAGAAHTVTVTVRDAYGNVATGYTGTVHFTSSDAQAGLPADYTFTGADAGVHTFNVVLKTSGAQSVTAADLAAPTLKATQGGVTVGAAAAATFAVTGYPAATAGTAHTFTVTARDAFGNVAAGYTGRVHFTSSDGQAALPVDYTFTAGDAGVHTFSATLKTAGAQSLIATDAVTATITGAQSGIVISAAAATHFRISAPTRVQAGTAFSITVTALDAFGNVAVGYRGTIRFTSSDKHAVLPPNYTFVSGDNGVHTFTFKLHSGGTTSVTATDAANGSIMGSTNVTVG